MNKAPFHMVWDQRVLSSNLSTPSPSRTETRTDTGLSPVTVARFWSKVAVGEKVECWPWIGAVSRNGYGSFRVPELGRATQSAHRVAYRLSIGVWPDGGLLIRHKCDNRRCVNPDHLETGTHVENARDMMERGGWAGGVARGEYNGRAKLTADNVATIRDMLARGRTNTAIGKGFGVHHATISAIRRGKSWSKP